MSNALGRWALHILYGIGLLSHITACYAGDQPDRIVVGYATYYTQASCKREGANGVWTASGERYEEAALTCALPHHPFGGVYRVCTTDRALCVVVRHNDYGPGRRPRKRGVVIDLTPAAFNRLASLRTGRVAVSVERVK